MFLGYRNPDINGKRDYLVYEHNIFTTFPPSRKFSVGGTIATSWPKSLLTQTRFPLHYFAAADEKKLTRKSRFYIHLPPKKFVPPIELLKMFNFCQTFN